MMVFQMRFHYQDSLRVPSLAGIISLCVLAPKKVDLGDEQGDQALKAGLEPSYPPLPVKKRFLVSVSQAALKG